MSSPAPLTRRALLFGRTSAPSGPRPPWAQPEHAFSASCTRCDACVQACPESVLERGPDGLPRFDASAGECTFCGDCASACVPKALDASISPPWELRASVADECLSGRGVVCSSCREACPESAIHIAPGGRGMARIDAQRCTGCGACVSLCPVDAIVLAHALLEVVA